MSDDVLRRDMQEEDRTLDQTLRPRRFEDFIGQTRIKENLRIYIEAARKRQEAIDHVLFSGPPGLGKTTLACIIAHELQVELRATSGPVIEKAGDLAGLLTKLQEGDVLFIDEIHRVSAAVEEYLYSAMEDYCIDIVLDQGPSARAVRIPLPRFTLIGSTTREGLLTAPFRSRFGVVERLGFYPWEDLKQIALNSARALNIQLEDDGAEILARRARGTPRLVNRFLRRLRDMAEVLADGVITATVATEGLGRLGVDERGLGPMDRQILETVLRVGGQPVGLKTIAVTVGEEEDTIEDVYEPFLIQVGYIEKTPRGRVPTQDAFRDYGQGLPPAGSGPDGQGKLFGGG
jgi:Holliday junction DNA helicase RuvB